MERTSKALQTKARDFARDGTEGRVMAPRDGASLGFHSCICHCLQQNIEPYPGPGVEASEGKKEESEAGLGSEISLSFKQSL